MIFEIINPSDPYTLESDDFEVACVATLAVGKGMYGLSEHEGSREMPIFILGGEDVWFQETFGNSIEVSIKRCVEEKKQQLIDVLKSVLVGDVQDRETYNDGLELISDETKREQWKIRWHEERVTSLNDIGHKACQLTEGLSKQ